VEIWVYQVGRDFKKENKVKFNLSWFNVIDFDLVNFLRIFILLFVLHMSSYIALNVNKHRLNGNTLCGLIKSLSPIAILV
jgi:hypothetical protein